MLAISTTNKITVLIKLGVVGVTGLTDADIICTLVKSDGTNSILSLTGIISEVDSVNSPGLYLVAIPSTAVSISGPISLTFVNVTPGTFDSFSYTNEVGISANDFISIRKYLLNNEIVDQTNGLLKIMDDNGVDVFLSYYLQDEQSKPSIFNIRRKIKV